MGRVYHAAGEVDGLEEGCWVDTVYISFAILATGHVG